ncbi:Site-specific DNA recombinase [Alteribacillus persepolensis]|uniref:Site-specific DNA recombinase n=1 Tax=Alteribacillus persepolensis TaxID=568899 RepID=A0A1G8IF80_9BACI|nr:recombinase family protein [Alteribacillus persepolensis]SDI17668.1 Site-specific DNA recombinase [Alteribacillus persepolensis]
MQTCMYLRKSRADLEAEARGEGETLSKHKRALLKIAKKMNLNIVKIRQEIVSGESLVHRPEMLELLKEVEANEYDAVLVMDIDRLGRGNMQEQGLILDAFRNSNTKIITTRKTYDLSDEWDEEYTEFETFMSRKELKIINRRLQGGRVRSIEEGNYIATNPPYGYTIKKDGKSRTLEPHPDQAPIVKKIFEWYTDDNPKKRIGTGEISNRLNNMGVTSYRGQQWGPSVVRAIIKNAVYAGRIQWKRKDIKKSTTPGKKKDSKTRPKEEWIDVKGKHEPLVSPDLFAKAQDILESRYHVPYNIGSKVTNPLAGLIYCGFCGKSMVRRPYTDNKVFIICHNGKNCGCRSSKLEYVETRLLEGLQKWLDQYKANWEEVSSSQENHESDEVDEADIIKKTIQQQKNELKELNKQKMKLFDLLERDIYNEETFLERSQHITERIKETENQMEENKKELELLQDQEAAQEQIIPHVENVLHLYPQTEDIKKKNTLLKSVVEKAVYKKTKQQRLDNFELTIFPRLPKKNSPYYV